MSSTTIPEDFDPWRPVWIVVNAKDHASKQLVDAAVFHGGGYRMMYYLAIFTSEKLAKNWITEREKPEWKPLPMLMISDLISFLELLMVGVSHVDVRYVGIDVGENTGIFIQVSVFLQELYHHAKHLG